MVSRITGGKCRFDKAFIDVTVVVILEYYDRWTAAVRELGIPEGYLSEFKEDGIPGGQVRLRLR